MSLGDQQALQALSKSLDNFINHHAFSLINKGTDEEENDEEEDAELDDFCEEKTTYCAYEGNITSFTDDAVAFMYPDAEWVECFEPINCTET